MIVAYLLVLVQFYLLHIISAASYLSYGQNLSLHIVQWGWMLNIV